MCTTFVKKKNIEVGGRVVCRTFETGHIKERGLCVERL